MGFETFTMMMKHLLILLGLMGSVYAEELTDVDRDLLLDKLDQIQRSANTASKGRYASAVAAFREAAVSDVAAGELYIKCIEKIEFLDQAKKTSDFRAWRKRHKDNVDGPGFRRALRYQLKWLLTTIEVAHNPEARMRAPDAGIAMIEAILRDADLLKGNVSILRGSVLSSAFAKGYELNDLQVENWVDAPFSIGGMYDIVILPLWQNEDSSEMLEKGWNKRIEHTGLAVQKFTREGERDRIPAMEQWLQNGRLDLVWSKEKDLFKYGNQRATALRMLEHVSVNLKHPKAITWAEEFKTMVQKEEEPVEEASSDGAAFSR